ncbi:MAG: hypothetical protein AB7L92_01270 [Alphaproteobacteria bacterium]
MRVFVVHTKDHVKAALQAARQASCPMALQSTPDAIFYAGPLYLLTMFRQVKQDFPDVEATFTIDCADAHAEAIQAMQVGHTHIRSSAPQKIQTKLAAIAAEHGVTWQDFPYEALDLQLAGSTTDAMIESITRDLCK